MKPLLQRLTLGLGALAFAGLVAACDKPAGPAEKAGKSLDNAGQSIKDAVDPPGPAQKAGRAIDDATGADK